MPKKLYEILGLDEDASPASIKRASKAYILTNHPDKDPSATPEELAAMQARLQEGLKARDILLNPKTRKAYDVGEIDEQGKNVIPPVANQAANSTVSTAPTAPSTAPSATEPTQAEPPPKTPKAKASKSPKAEEPAPTETKKDKKKEPKGPEGRGNQAWEDWKNLEDLGRMGEAAVDLYKTIKTTIGELIEKKDLAQNPINEQTPVDPAPETGGQEMRPITQATPSTKPVLTVNDEQLMAITPSDKKEAPVLDNEDEDDATAAPTRK